MSLTRETNNREAEGSTRIKISDPVADDLFERKSRGESYNDVLKRVLEISSGGSEQ